MPNNKNNTDEITEIREEAPAKKELSSDEKALLTLIGAADPEITGGFYKELHRNDPNDTWDEEITPKDEDLSFSVFREIAADQNNRKFGSNDRLEGWKSKISESMTGKLSAYSESSDAGPLAQMIARSILNVGFSGVNCPDLSDGSIASIKPAADLYAFLQKHEDLYQAALDYAKNNGLKDDFELGLEKCRRAGILRDFRNKYAESQKALDLHYSGEKALELNDLTNHIAVVRKFNIINEALADADEKRMAYAQKQYGKLLKDIEGKASENDKSRYYALTSGMLDRYSQTHAEDGLVALLYSDYKNTKLDEWIKYCSANAKEQTVHMLKVRLKAVYDKKLEQHLLSPSGFEETAEEKSTREAAEKLRMFDYDRTVDEIKARNAALAQHAKVTADFSQFEIGSSVAKAKLRDMCLEFRARSKDDETLQSVLDDINKYLNMEIAPGDDSAYKDEAVLVNKIKNALRDHAEALDEREKSLNEKAHEAVSRAEGETDEQYAKRVVRLDKAFNDRLDSIDVCRNITASLGYYFAKLTDGKLIPPMNYMVNGRESIEKTEEEELRTAMSTPGGYYHKTKSVIPEEEKDKSINYDIEEFIFINAVGVDLDISTDKNDGAYIENLYTDTSSKVIDVKDRPIFPHEPRITDIDQSYNGNCYILSVLQNVARLYPEKIKEMIVDNGDGSATVRFFSGETPVYVRLSKELAMRRGTGAGNRNSLWVSLIEQAYAYSGMHLCSEFKLRTEVPYNPKAANMQHYLNTNKDKILDADNNADKRMIDDIKRDCPHILEYADKTKKTYRVRPFKPALKHTEGGWSGSFAQVCFGPDFSRRYIDINRKKDSMIGIGIADIAPKDYKDCEKWYKEFDQYIKERTDCSDYYKKLITQDLKLEDNASADEITEALYKKIVNSDKVNTEKIQQIKNEIRSVYDTIMNPESKITTNKSPGTMSSILYELRSKIGADEKGLRDDLRYKTNAFNLLSSPLSYRMAMLNGFNSSMYKTFYELKSALDQGLPVYLGTLPKTKTITNIHAYSIIDAYQTEDEPPRFFVRLRNPWGPSTNEKTLVDTGEVDEGRNKIIEAIDSDNGIFDVELSALLDDTKEITYSYSDKLAEEIKKNGFNEIQDYKVVPGEEESERKKEIITEDAYAEYLRCAEDICIALKKTNSYFSKDSGQYKELYAAAQAFSVDVAKLRGEKMDKLFEAAAKLDAAAKNYVEHLPKNPKGRTGRQKSRADVCETIKKLAALSGQKSKDPRAEFEKDFAKEFVKKYMKKNDIRPSKYTKEDLKDPAMLQKYNNSMKKKTDKITERLLENRMFKTAAGKLTINELEHPSKSNISDCVKQFEKLLKNPYAQTKLNAELAELYLDAGSMVPQK